MRKMLLSVKMEREGHCRDGSAGESTGCSAEDARPTPSTHMVACDRRQLSLQGIQLVQPPRETGTHMVK